MKIDMRGIDTVTPYPKNPRLNDAAVGAVARSLKEYGFRQPIVVDTEGVIVVGHTRWKAAKQLGMTEVPVHVASELTPEQAKAYRLADNRSNQIAEWDMELLPIEIAELKDLGCDLSLLGWSADELTEIMAPPGTPGLVDADEVPETPTVATAKRGDLWVLGQHRILCGDSTNPADVDRLMGGEKSALCATDPPYLVDYTGSRIIGGKERGKDWSDTYKEVDIPDAYKFFQATFSNVLRVIKANTAIYCWHAHKRQAMIDRVWEELGILSHQQIIWVKPTPVFGRVFWHFQHEPCMMGWVKGSMPQHDGDQTLSSIWSIDWEGKKKFTTGDHPTQKPVEIFARPMRKHTKPGDICFEPFSGSGSQIVAAEQQGRRCFAMELEPVFVDVAIKRWETFTGKKAELERKTEAA